MKDVFAYVSVILAFLLVASFVLFFTFGSIDAYGYPAETVSFYRIFQFITKIPEIMEGMASQFMTIWDVHTDHYAISSPDSIEFDEHGNPIINWSDTITYDFSPFDANESDNWFYGVAVGFFDGILGFVFRLICTFFLICNYLLSVPFLILQALMYNGFIVNFDVIRAGPFGGAA